MADTGRKLDPARDDQRRQLPAVIVASRDSSSALRHRYVAGSSGHPHRMNSRLAAALITDYTRPGDLVFDPLAGVGTTLVEAIHAGRNAIGADIEPGWVALARANITLARRHGATGHARMQQADSTRAPRGAFRSLRGQVSLVLTSPPQRTTMPGRPAPVGGRIRRETGSGADTARRQHRITLRVGMTAVLTRCRPLLGRHGLIVLVAPRLARASTDMDLPTLMVQIGLTAGLPLIALRWAIAGQGDRGVRHGNRTPPPAAPDDPARMAAPLDTVAVFRRSE